MKIIVDGSIHKLLKLVSLSWGPASHATLKFGKFTGRIITCTWEESLYKGGTFVKDINMMVENGLIKRHRMRPSCEPCKRRLKCLETNRCTKEKKFYTLTGLGKIVLDFLESRSQRQIPASQRRYHEENVKYHSKRTELQWERFRDRDRLVLTKPGRKWDILYKEYV